MSAEVRTFTIEGLPMERAPLNLVPYLDCVDGAVAVGAGVHFRTGQRFVIWALFRAGARSGESIWTSSRCGPWCASARAS